MDSLLALAVGDVPEYQRGIRQTVCHQTPHRQERDVGMLALGLTSKDNGGVGGLHVVHVMGADEQDIPPVVLAAPEWMSSRTGSTS